MAQAEAGYRTREVLGPDFVEDLTDLPIQEVRRRDQVYGEDLSQVPVDL
jgi:hypothetical protein